MKMRKPTLLREVKKIKKSTLYNIPIEGVFLNKTVGFEYGKKEQLYLKYMANKE